MESYTEIAGRVSVSIANMQELMDLNIVDGQKVRDEIVYRDMTGEERLKGNVFIKQDVVDNVRSRIADICNNNKMNLVYAEPLVRQRIFSLGEFLAAEELKKHVDIKFKIYVNDYKLISKTLNEIDDYCNSVNINIEGYEMREKEMTVHS